jgi:hypothetical protein
MARVSVRDRSDRTWVSLRAFDLGLPVSPMDALVEGTPVTGR